MLERQIMLQVLSSLKATEAVSLHLSLLSQRKCFTAWLKVYLERQMIYIVWFHLSGLKGNSSGLVCVVIKKFWDCLCCMCAPCAQDMCESGCHVTLCCQHSDLRYECFCDHFWVFCVFRTTRIRNYTLDLKLQPFNPHVEDRQWQWEVGLWLPSTEEMAVFTVEESTATKLERVHHVRRTRTMLVLLNV